MLARLGSPCSTSASEAGTPGSSAAAGTASRVSHRRIAARSSADKPVFAASRSRPNFFQQSAPRARITTEVFGRGPRSSADKPVFAASRSRPNFFQQSAPRARITTEVFGGSARSSADKPVFAASRSRPNFFQQSAPTARITTEVFGRGPRRASHRSRTVRARRTARLLRLEAERLIHEDRGDSTRRSHVVDDENVVHSARDSVGLPGAAGPRGGTKPLDPSQATREGWGGLSTALQQNPVAR